MVSHAQKGEERKTNNVGRETINFTADFIASTSLGQR
jgi:hypothetical protein